MPITFEKAGSKDWLRFRSLTALGAILAARRAFAEAEPLLTAGARGLFDVRSMMAVRHHPVADEAAGLTAQMYEAWGKPAEAGQWRARAEVSRTAIR